jgi:pantothenate kinase type III
MLLAIDVGNTNIVLGVFDGAKLAANWRLLTLRERTADEVGLMTAGLFAHRQIDMRRIDAVVMGSVVPVLTPILRNMCATYFGRDPLVVDPVTNAGMPILYERPAEVGAIESGLFYGYLGMVDGLMKRMTDELGGRATRIATGGLAPLVLPETNVFDAHEPDITLHGLRIIWERNQ